MNDSVIPHSIAEAYSAQSFATMSQLWQATLTAHFQKVLAGDSRVLNWTLPPETVVLAEQLLQNGKTVNAEDRAAQFTSLLQQMLSSGQNLHHPGYIGHQVPASVPLAGLFDAVCSLTNQPMAIYEMGPWATAVEHALVRAFCRKIGWNPDTSTGVLTHGGSLANLTALLTARNVKFPNSWQDGVPPNAVLIAHADAHYCVARSAGILGIGTRRIIKATLDSKRRMNPAALDHTLTEAAQNGQQVMAVVACACATPIGAFDPIDAIADVCEKHGVWLHVDAAHGGSALMSRTHKSLLAGIEKADSVVWDAHKMMFVPALCAAILYKNSAHQFEAFQQDAPYLFDPSNAGPAQYDNGVSTVECTKRATGFGLWGVWSLFGDTFFEQLIDRTFSMCRYLHSQVEAAEDFEALHIPECNILVFRHLPQHITNSSLEQQNAFQRKLRSAVVNSGDFYIVQTTIDGMVGLRTCVMNPLTTESRIDQLLDRIRSLA
ncbi:MAG: aminotransferase class I/II-fold pyridoxal phosphate-dependent enzyme [Fuerstiella sp.]